MHRTDAPGNNAGLFTEGDPQGGVPATTVDSEWTNAVQEELVKLVLDAGISLNKADFTQVRAALDLLYLKRAERGALNGVASLDGTTKVPVAQIPDMDAAKITTGAFPQARIGAAAIGTGELKQTTSDVSTSSTSYITAILPGAGFGFYPQPSRGLTVGTFSVQFPKAYDPGGFPGIGAYIQIKVETTNVVVLYQTYIQASPPYDLGEGEIPLFLYGLVDSTGAVIATHAAPDPPWANNGPTNIRPDYHRNGKPYQRKRKLPAGLTSPMEKAGALMAWKAEERTALASANRAQEKGNKIDLKKAASELAALYEEIEVTQALKQKDMSLIPHPFPGYDKTKYSLVLLEPVGEMIEALATLREDGENINDLLYSGNLRVENTKSIIAGPPGVQVAPVKWKSTK